MDNITIIQLCKYDSCHDRILSTEDRICLCQYRAEHLHEIPDAIADKLDKIETAWENEGFNDYELRYNEARELTVSVNGSKAKKL